MFFKPEVLYLLDFYITLAAIVLMFCVAFSKFFSRFGVPSLLLFVFLGMLFGSDGIVGIPFDNYRLAEEVCSTALIFIMFYGGFGTNWKAARPVAVPAILMSSLGVVITCALTGLFCHFILHMRLLEGFLVGAVISSTDAASVFSILRSKKLNLKGGTASLLEIESGSNDPMSYMLTIVILSMMEPGTNISIFSTLVSQIFIGVLGGFAICLLSRLLLKKVSFGIQGLHTIFVIAIALISYSLPGILGGNGYLSVYIVGIVLGNSKILHKVPLIHFFDGITWLMQIVLFFVLGLLSFPSHFPSIILPATAIALFLLLIARPVAVFSILTWFKTPLRQQLLISWSGLRGAASIVFAIYTVTSTAFTTNDIFHIVFFVALISVAFQGSFLPAVAKKLQLIDEENTVFKTFNDYEDDTNTTLIEVTLEENSILKDKTLMEADFPENALVVMIKRGSKTLVPRGTTVLKTGDVLVINADDNEEFIREVEKRIAANC